MTFVLEYVEAFGGKSDSVLAPAMKCVFSSSKLWK